MFLYIPFEKNTNLVMFIFADDKIDISVNVKYIQRFNYNIGKISLTHKFVFVKQKVHIQSRYIHNHTHTYIIIGVNDDCRKPELG